MAKPEIMTAIKGSLIVKVSMTLNVNLPFGERASLVRVGQMRCSAFLK
jgi:hypothetical protein